MEEIKRRSCRANGGVSFWRKSTGLQIFASPRYTPQKTTGSNPQQVEPMSAVGQSLPRW